MNKLQTIQVIRECDKKRKFVFNKHDMSKLFPKDLSKKLEEGLSRTILLFKN